MQLAIIFAALFSPVFAAANSTIDFNPIGIRLHPIGDATSALPATNAERLRLGLPLKPPRAMRTHSARNAQPSFAPAPGYTGRIKCTDRDGALVGYFGGSVNSYGQWGLTGDAARAQHLLFAGRAPGGDASDLVALGGGPVPGLPFVGAVVGFASQSDDLRGGSPSFAYICPMSRTSPHSVPAAVSNAFNIATRGNRLAESAVWKLDPATKNITVQWVNTDRTPTEPRMVYVPSANAFAITKDVDQFYNNVNKDSKEVFLVLELV